MEQITMTDALHIINFLGANPYSALWSMIDKFAVNGHVVDVKGSTQWSQVVIDNRYVSIKNGVIYKGKAYAPLEYIKHLLEQ